MMKKTRVLNLSLLLASALFLQVSYSQDHTPLGLPKGAKARLGKGWISGTVAFSPDGTLLAVASSIGVWLYDANTGAEVNLLTGHTSFVTSVTFSPDGLVLAGAIADAAAYGRIRLWDVRTGEGLHTLLGHAGSVGSVAFSPDGLMLASGGWDDTIRLWDVRTGAALQTVEGHSDAIIGRNHLPSVLS